MNYLRNLKRFTTDLGVWVWMLELHTSMLELNGKIIWKLKGYCVHSI